MKIEEEKKDWIILADNCCMIKYELEPGWQNLRDHVTSGGQEVRVFYERKDP